MPPVLPARLLRGLTLLVLGAALTSCSAVGDTTRTVMRSMNPMNWFEDEPEQSDKSALGNKGNGEKPYPNLGSVPQRPDRPTPEEQAKKISEGLVADTENARYTDHKLRQNTAGLVGHPPGTSKIPLPTTSRPVSPPAAAEGASVVPPPPVTPPPPRGDAGNTVAPPAVRPPGPVADTPAVPALAPPVAAPVAAPEPQQSASVPPPPPVRRPDVAPPAGDPPMVRPPSVRAPQTAEAPTQVARPQPGPAPQKVEPPRRVEPPFATPSGTPTETPRPAPAPEPLRAPAQEPIVRVSPPPPAQVAASSANRTPVEQTQGGPAQNGQMKVMQVGTIYFGNGSSQLTSRDVSVIEAVIQVARQTGGRIRVVGHSSMGARSVDPERREATNFQMSLKRANSVAQELIRQGIPADRVEVVAQGDRQPLYAETSATGAAYNRRAEIFIDYVDQS